MSFYNNHHQIMRLSPSRYMFGLSAIPAVIQFFGFVAMPESPRYLVQRGKRNINTIVGLLKVLEELFELFNRKVF